MGEQLRAKVHTEDREASQRKSGSLCGSIEIPLYLFSNHLGLLVNLLPIGHITQEVMALSS